jgi:hypothetical protein
MTACTTFQKKKLPELLSLVNSDIGFNTAAILEEGQMIDAKQQELPLRIAELANVASSLQYQRERLKTSALYVRPTSYYHRTTHPEHWELQFCLD